MTACGWRSVGALLLGAGAAAVSLGAGAADALVQRGEYLARAGDCIACHTAPGGQPMAGGLALQSPLGKIISTNITPSRTHGIGNYTLAQFTDALRRGVRADGARLYPAMPYTSYAKVSDDDAGALYAYFMQGVAAVDSAPPPTQLPFPFNIRLSMLAWNALYLDDAPYRDDPAKGAQWNRGAYLVQGLAHCSACHTPRGPLMAEDRSRALAGGEVWPWYAPNITSHATSGIGGWSQAELVEYLREGHAAGKSQAAGPMAEAIDFSLRHLTAPDLDAIAGYLKTVAPVADPRVQRPAYAWGAPTDNLESIRGLPWPRSHDQLTGPQIYDAYCASCHQAQAQGSFDGGLPSLLHNAALGRNDSNNLVMVVLQGLHRHPDVHMPGFAAELSDGQVATLGNYLLHQWGNPDASVTVKQVGQLRAGTPGRSFLLTLAQLVMAAAVLLLIIVVVFLVRRRNRKHGRSMP
ncbi:MAG: cytochrome [Ramlibacter sp.]|nr:cytochrome [Ramlibacter sp.]